MLFKLRSYLKFLIHSTNQHGVHSPFVYNFVTKCLYNKPKQSKKQRLNVLLKSIAYFNFENISILENKPLKKEIEKNFPYLKWHIEPFDLVYYPYPDLNAIKSLVYDEQIQNDSMILLDNIYTSKETNAIWNSLKDLPEIIVSIDLFYCGLLFFRKEQEKEHFTIRI